MTTDTAANQSGNAGIFTSEATKPTAIPAAVAPVVAATELAATAPVSVVAPVSQDPKEPVEEVKAPDSADAQLAAMSPADREKAELDSLKKKATLIGLTFSNNIGVEALRAKIQEKLAGDTQAATAAAPVAQSQVNAFTGEAAKETDEIAAEVEAQSEPQLSPRQQMLSEQMKLIRCHIVNLDPKKKDLPGEIISVANELLGNVRKFILFGESTENGYHIPYVIYKLLERRKFLQIRTRRDPRTGTNVTTQAWVKEFSIRILEPLTKEQLRDLAQAQIAAGSIDGNN